MQISLLFFCICLAYFYRFSSFEDELSAFAVSVILQSSFSSSTCTNFGTESLMPLQYSVSSSLNFKNEKSFLKFNLSFIPIFTVVSASSKIQQTNANISSSKRFSSFFTHSSVLNPFLLFLSSSPSTTNKSSHVSFSSSFPSSSFSTPFSGFNNRISLMIPSSIPANYKRRYSFPSSFKSSDEIFKLFSTPVTLSPPPPPTSTAFSTVNVGQAVAQQIYEDLLFGRLFEDTVAQQYYRGKIAGFVHLYTGQEAISTGVIKTLRSSDFVVSTYREHVHAISKGVPPKEVLAELYGKQTGCSKGRGGSMHIFSKSANFIGGFAFIGEQIPIALGAAFASAYKGVEEDGGLAVSVCFLGDGTTNNGQFFEALNMASLMKLPIIFVVENNNWAIGMAAYRSTRIPEIYKKVEGFGMPGIEVDGMDVLAVRAATREAVDRARAGEGPTLIEALTYRFRGHSLADPDELRAPEERKAWLERDPLVLFGNYMKRMGYANDATLRLTRSKIRAIMDEAVEYAENSPNPCVEDVANFIMSNEKKTYGEDELTAEQLNKYAEALAEELRNKELKKNGVRNPGTPIQLQKNPLTIID